MSATALTAIRRILVALDASPGSLAALEAAAALAAHSEAELLGIFVEDIELLHAATLPCVREVSLVSARTRRIEHGSIERSLRAQAARAEAALARLAATHRLRASFRVTRGAVLAELIAAAQEADMLALGLAGFSERTRTRPGATVLAALATSACPLLLFTPQAQLDERVATIYDGSAPATAALQLAATLALTRDAHLLVLLLADDPAQEVQLRERAREDLPQGFTRARFRWLVDVAPASLARALAEAEVGTVVLSAAAPLGHAASVQALLHDGRVALWLLR
jgi:hypothetical protein